MTPKEEIANLRKAIEALAVRVNVLEGRIRSINESIRRGMEPEA